MIFSRSEKQKFSGRCRHEGPQEILGEPGDAGGLAIGPNADRQRAKGSQEVREGFLDLNAPAVVGINPQAGRFAQEEKEDDRHKHLAEADDQRQEVVHVCGTCRPQAGPPG